MKKYYKHKLKNLIHVERIVTIHYFEFGKDFNTDGEAHDFWELVYAQKESVICTADGNRLTLAEGEILFHRPNEFHTLSANGENAPNVFIVSFVCRSDAMRYFEEKSFRVDPSLVRFIYLIFEEGKKTFDLRVSDPNRKKMQLLEHPALGGEQLIKNYLEIFLIELLRSRTETKQGNRVFLQRNEFESKPVNEVIEILKQSLATSVTIQEICERTSYGKSYLFRIFKAKTGKTIIQYYQDLKMERAKQLLRENEMSIREISDALCFGEPSYFSKTFKRIVGMTPTEYKHRAMML